MHALFYFIVVLCFFLVSHQFWYYLNHDLEITVVEFLKYAEGITKTHWMRKLSLEILETQKTREIGEK